MSEMIDGYNAQKIKDFWMAQPPEARLEKIHADVQILFNEIDALRAEINELRAKNSNQFLQNAELIFTADEQLVQIDLQSRQIGELVDILKDALILYQASKNPTQLWEGWGDNFYAKVEKVLRSVEQGKK